MSLAAFVLAKWRKKYIWERIFRERLAEPLHLNSIAAFVALFGSFRAKVYFDLVLRQHNAYALLAAADAAKDLGIGRFTAIEFGVASGAGLLNMIEIGTRVTRATGVEIDLVGFDNGSGMPEPTGYRDHPEYYRQGDFQMESREALERALPPNARLIIGDIGSTLPAFMESQSANSPIGFVSIDVDFYSSTIDCLPAFRGEATNYLPLVSVYLDDVMFAGHCRWAGELLAVEEFSRQEPLRRIGPSNFLREWRLFKRPAWISHMYTLHVFDHPARSTREGTGNAVLINPMLPPARDSKKG